jgi:hypothetical protein
LAPEWNAIAKRIPEIGPLPATEEGRINEDLCHLTSQTLSLGCSFNEERSSGARKLSVSPNSEPLFAEPDYSPFCLAYCRPEGSSGASRFH